MAKLKVTVGQDAYDESGASDIEPPKPGVYNCKVLEINHGFSADEATKKPDKNRPRLEVIYQITDEKAKTRGNDGGSALNARLWQYITFGENVQWKLAGFLKAFGIPFKKVGGNLEFDLDTATLAESVTDVDPRTMKAKPAKKTGHEGAKCRVKVKPDSNQSGEYRAGVGSVLPPKDDDDDADFGDDDDDVVADDDVIAEDEVTEDDDFTEEDEGGDEASEYTKEDLTALSPAELKEVVAAFNEVGHSIVIKGKKKSEVIDLILEAQASASEGEDDDEDMADDDDEMVEDEEASEAYTEESLKAMEPADLKEVAKAHDVKFGGLKKSQVIAAILAAQSKDGAGNSENPF
jgi:hypothetical protein